MPKGCLIDQESIFVQHFEKIHLYKCIPQANSTTSRPLITEPLASSSVFPCSDEIILASISILFSIKFIFDNT